MVTDHHVDFSIAQRATQAVTFIAGTNRRNNDAVRAKALGVLRDEKQVMRHHLTRHSDNVAKAIHDPDAMARRKREEVDYRPGLRRDDAGTRDAEALRQG